MASPGLLLAFLGPLLALRGRVRGVAALLGVAVKVIAVSFLVLLGLGWRRAKRRSLPHIVVALLIPVALPGAACGRPSSERSLVVHVAVHS